VPKGIESGKKLSDFPEFAQHIRRLRRFRQSTERFWVDGVFKDDLGLKVTGAFGKIYETPSECAVMAANLTDKPSVLNFEIECRRYGIEEDTFSSVSSTGRVTQEHGERVGGMLKARITLSANEVVAIIFRRHGEAPANA
jgi:hypothetical protein